MSSKRLNKRQLREQQELDELADAPVPTASSSATSKKSPFQQLDDSDVNPSNDEDDVDSEPAHASNVSRKPTTTSLFAALGDGTDGQQDADDQDDSESDHDISTQQASKSSKKKKNKKKKKAAAATATTEEGADAKLHSEDQPTTQQHKTNGPSKKSSKKKASSTAPAANAGSKDVSEMSIDEFDALLASQASLNAANTSNNTARSGSTAPSTLNRVSAFRTHLSLDPRNLDPAIELRRQFGSAAIKAYQNEADSSGRATSGARARAQANNPNLKVRSILCTPKDHWPPISRSFTGMSMDVLDSRSHGRICAWKHSKAYRQVQMQFLQAVRSYDPNALMALLRVYPYHIDTLLQLSEYSRHQGDLGQAADFNDRALFALERCASPYFTSCLSSTTSGPPLVNFNKIENRAFYMAIHRNIGFLGRRGTWKTALEWAKLLLGLGQDGEDHHAALLWIDFLAIKSRQHRWLLELIERLDEQRSRASAAGGKVSHVDEVSVPAKTIVDATDKEPAGEGAGYNGTLDWCVGLAYSRALAFRAVEKEEGDKTHTRSNSALRLAIARFPAVAPLLCNKAGVELPSKIAGHPAFQLSTRYSGSSDTLADLLTHIYVLRSESLWKEPGYGEWLRSTTMSLSDALTADFDLSESKRKTQPASASHNTRQGIYRHVLVSDVPDTTRQQLIAYLPPSITGSSEQMDAFDPVPPRSAPLSSSSGGDAEADVDREVETVTRYDDEYFAPIMSDLSSRSRSAGAAGGGQAGGGGMMQAFRRALQGLGGVQGWDAAMEAMDDETREDVMAQVMQMAQAAHGDGAIPGGFGEENDDEAEEMDAARPGAFAAIRAAMDAIWGGGGGAEAGQGEHQGEEHDGEVDHQEEE